MHFKISLTHTQTDTHTHTQTPTNKQKFCDFIVFIDLSL